MNYSKNAIDNAAACLARGDVVAYPTEAVWGVGCDPFNYEAVKKILQIKQRPQYKGLILVAASTEQLSPLLSQLSFNQVARLNASWPGSTTWVIEDTESFYPSWVKGEHSSIAVRVSDHPLVKALCDAFGGAVVSTSANPSGLPPASSEAQAREYFSEKVDCYVSGSTGGNKKPSNIYILNSGKLVR